MEQEEDSNGSVIENVDGIDFWKQTSRTEAVNPNDTIEREVAVVHYQMSTSENAEGIRSHSENIQAKDGLDLHITPVSESSQPNNKKRSETTASVPLDAQSGLSNFLTQAAKKAILDGDHINAQKYINRLCELRGMGDVAVIELKKEIMLCRAAEGSRMLENTDLHSTAKYFSELIEKALTDQDRIDLKNVFLNLCYTRARKILAISPFKDLELSRILEMIVHIVDGEPLATLVSELKYFPATNPPFNGLDWRDWDVSNFEGFRSFATEVENNLSDKAMSLACQDISKDRPGCEITWIVKTMKSRGFVSRANAISIALGKSICKTLISESSIGINRIAQINSNKTPDADCCHDLVLPGIRPSTFGELYKRKDEENLELDGNSMKTLIMRVDKLLDELQLPHSLPCNKGYENYDRLLISDPMGIIPATWEKSYTESEKITKEIINIRLQAIDMVSFYFTELFFLLVRLEQWEDSLTLASWMVDLNKEISINVRKSSEPWIETPDSSIVREDFQDVDPFCGPGAVAKALIVITYAHISQRTWRTIRPLEIPKTQLHEFDAEFQYLYYLSRAYISYFEFRDTKATADYCQLALSIETHGSNKLRCERSDALYLLSRSLIQQNLLLDASYYRSFVPQGYDAWRIYGKPGKILRDLGFKLSSGEFKMDPEGLNRVIKSTLGRKSPLRKVQDERFSNTYYCKSIVSGLFADSIDWISIPLDLEFYAFHFSEKQISITKGSALHLYAASGEKELLKIALNNPWLDVDCRDGDGKTPLHWSMACQDNQLFIVELLLKYGARVDSLDKWRMTPLHKMCKIKPDQKLGDGYIVLLHMILDKKPVIASLDYKKATVIHRLTESLRQVAKVFSEQERIMKSTKRKRWGFKGPIDALRDNIRYIGYAFRIIYAYLRSTNQDFDLSAKDADGKVAFDQALYEEYVIRKARGENLDVGFKYSFIRSDKAKLLESQATMAKIGPGTAEKVRVSKGYVSESVGSSSSNPPAKRFKITNLLRRKGES